MYKTIYIYKFPFVWLTWNPIGYFDGLQSIFYLLDCIFICFTFNYNRIFMLKFLCIYLN
jgi:hypothetical protein